MAISSHRKTKFNNTGVKVGAHVRIFDFTIYLNSGYRTNSRGEN